MVYNKELSRIGGSAAEKRLIFLSFIVAKYYATDAGSEVTYQMC